MQLSIRAKDSTLDTTEARQLLNLDEHATIGVLTAAHEAIITHVLWSGDFSLHHRSVRAFAELMMAGDYFTPAEAAAYVTSQDAFAARIKPMLEQHLARIRAAEQQRDPAKVARGELTITAQLSQVDLPASATTTNSQPPVVPTAVERVRRAEREACIRRFKQRFTILSFRRK